MAYDSKSGRGHTLLGVRLSVQLALLVLSTLVVTTLIVLAIRDWAGRS